MKQIALALLLFSIVAGCSAPSPSDEVPDWQPSQMTEEGLFRVTVEPEMEPPKINTIHEWVVTIEDPDGTPLDDVEVVLDGGMPAHQHGLPSQPKMTRALGQGRYVIEGVKFSMPGHWEMRLSVTSGEQFDEAVFHLYL